jgi:uncharacterized protein YdbL (DUF1318 family)
MINRRTILLIVPALLFAAIPALADRKADLQAKFRERLAAVDKLKHAGSVGETFDGWLAAVKDQSLDDAAKKLVADENADRKELYQIIADEEKTSADTVGKRNALRNYKNGKAGDWFKLESGEWKQKA